MFQEKELHIYNKTQQNGFPHQVTISNPLQFSLQPQRQISDDRSMQSASPPPQKKEIKYETFRTLDNLAPSNLSDAERKKLNKRFRHVDIGSTSLRGITKNIASSGDNIDPEVKEKAINQLNEWINRRVTGYLIFQNTMNQNPLEQTDKGNYKELGIHLNNITGQKWKNLNDEDRDEYRNLAKEYRKILRKEIEAYENYDDITDLIEQFDQKIKKIKKE